MQSCSSWHNLKFSWKIDKTNTYVKLLWTQSWWIDTFSLIPQKLGWSYKWYYLLKCFCLWHFVWCKGIIDNRLCPSDSLEVLPLSIVREKEKLHGNIHHRTITTQTGKSFIIRVETNKNHMHWWIKVNEKFSKAF